MTIVSFSLVEGAKEIETASKNTEENTIKHLFMLTTSKNTVENVIKYSFDPQ